MDVKEKELIMQLCYSYSSNLYVGSRHILRPQDPLHEGPEPTITSKVSNAQLIVGAMREFVTSYEQLVVQLLHKLPLKGVI
jgi:hypothetical protein